MNNIRTLLSQFPEDKLTSAGTLFWSGAKRPPRVLQFDPKDELHVGFVTSVADLYADMYCLPIPLMDSAQVVFYLASLFLSSLIRAHNFLKVDGVYGTSTCAFISARRGW